MSNLVFEETEKQAEFIQAVLSRKYRVLLFGGAIRGGKTFVALAIAIILCQIYPRCRVTIVRQSLKRLKDNTRPSINKFIEGAGVQINEQDQTFTFKNQSRIIFKGENFDRDKTLESFKGHETNFFIGEEVSEIRYATYLKMIERAGSYVISPRPANGQPKGMIIMTCNPTQAWIKEEVYTPWKEGRLPDDVFYLPSYVTDNPYLDEDYVEGLKKLPTYEYEVFVKGNWDITLKQPNAFFHAFDVNRHIVPALSIDRSTILHVSIDSNSMPYCAATIWQLYPEEKRAIQVYEIKAEPAKRDSTKPSMNHATGLGTLLCNWLSEIEYNDILHVFGDSTTKSQNTIDPLKRSFYSIFIETVSEKFHTVDFLASKNPPIASTGEFANALLSGWDGWRLEIFESCKTSISDYLEVKKAADGTMQKKRITDEDGNSFEPHGHISDTLRYFLFKALNNEYTAWMNRFSVAPEPIAIDLGDIDEFNID